jgi:serine/threonine protein kinase
MDTQSETDTDSDEDYGTLLIPSIMKHTTSSQVMTPTDERIEKVRSLFDNKYINTKPVTPLNPCETEVRLEKINKSVHDLSTVFGPNIHLQYIKSGSTGNTFMATTSKGEKFAVKVCAIPKDKYGGIHNHARPENAELRMLKLLCKFVVDKKTPHIVIPITTFNTNITKFTNVEVPKNNKSYKKFVKKYNAGKFYDNVSVLVSEWCNGGDLLDYVRSKKGTITEDEWINMLFQFLHTLAIIQNVYPCFRHNDLKPNNVLLVLDENYNSKKYRQYLISNDKYKYTFTVPNIGQQVMLWDFDFGCIKGHIENNKVNAEWTSQLHITNEQNRYYDVHYFFNSLFSDRFLNGFRDFIPRRILNFVNRIIPVEYRTIDPVDEDNPPLNVKKGFVTSRGRILSDRELTTPFKIITTDELFKDFRSRSKI